MPVIPAFGKWGQEHQEFKAILDHIRPSLKDKKQFRTGKMGQQLSALAALPEGFSL